MTNLTWGADRHTNEYQHFWTTRATTQSSMQRSQNLFFDTLCELGKKWPKSERTMAHGLPPHVSVPLNRLCEDAMSFIKYYKENEQKMQAIRDELQEISNDYEKMVNETQRTNLSRGALTGLGCVVALSSVGFSVLHGGSEKLLALAGGVGVLTGFTAAITGVTTSLNANLKKTMREQQMLNTVKQLVEKFLNITGPQKNILEDIKRLSDELEEKGSFIRTTAGAQAIKTLLEIEAFQVLQRQIDELTEDVKAAPFIAQSARQCEKTIDELGKMKTELKDFEEN